MSPTLSDIQDQTLNFTLSDGSILPIPLEIFDQYVQYGIRICINYASQIGASVVLLVVLAILTKAEKRTSAVFILNIIALILNIIRNVIMCTYFTGAFYSVFTYFSGQYNMVPQGDIATSITGDIFRTFLIMTIEASLILQVRAVVVTMSRKYRMAILTLSGLVALTVLALRTTLMAYNIRAIVNLQSFYEYQWLAAASLYMTTASICFFSAIFTTKLAVALKHRRTLGLRQFGPMQIIFIMGCQTLFIPAIFSILQWVTAAPELGSQVETLVALFLPLSAMWASKSINSGAPRPSVINSKGRSGLFGFLSARRGSRFFTRNSTKQSTAQSIPTASTNSTIAPNFSDKEHDLEPGHVKTSRTQSVDVSAEKA